MNATNLVPCGIPRCYRPAMKGAIFGTQRFCVVPASDDSRTALPLIRYNLCETHLQDVRSNFTEVNHDIHSADFSEVAVYV